MQLNDAVLNNSKFKIFTFLILWNHVCYFKIKRETISYNISKLFFESDKGDITTKLLMMKDSHFIIYIVVGKGTIITLEFRQIYFSEFNTEHIQIGKFTWNVIEIVKKRSEKRRRNESTN